MAVALDLSHLKKFISEEELRGLSPFAVSAHEALHQKTGLGNDFLGWVELPFCFDGDEFARIKAAAERIRQNSEVLLVIGIGGSYLGARAAIEFLQSPFYNALPKSTPDIYFVGNNLSGSYLNDILKIIEGRDVSVNVISKSGTTTEPAVAFRYFKNYLEEKYGKQGARERIFATTDSARGTLKELSDAEGYETFVIPDDVGGRYSVLTAVGLLPIAVAGCDVDALMEGAADAARELADVSPERNAAMQYAIARNILARRGFSLEMLGYYEPGFAMMAEWFKQLFGESEGKDGKGLFPVSAGFSTDLHSLGQFIQAGSRIMFETVVLVDTPPSDIDILIDPDDKDGLNFLAGRPMSYVNRKASEGTLLAHAEEGGVPNILIRLSDTGAHTLGYLFYFLMKSCAVSGYLLGVNPFNQPGVESYKKNMFALLGKPGYEELRAELEGKLRG